MLRRAHELCPNEAIYAYSYLGSFSNAYGTRENELQQVQNVLEDRFKGEGLLSDYFKSIYAQ
ncbi:hypothetical protein [Exiguobacterium sp. E.VS.2]|nr:hypothetical protein [Exiguobacterium sp. E.VS.2]